MSRRARSRRGSTLLEFTFAGICVAFTLISIFEVARGMWVYQMEAYAIREGVRYASVHGSGCASPNTCSVTVGTIASYIQTAGPLIDPTSTLTFTAASGTPISGSMTSLKTNTTTWPPSGSNTAGQTIQISISFPYKTVLAMLWTGAGPPLTDVQTFHMKASSSEPIQF